MKLYKESNVVYQHQEIYEAMRKLSEYRKEDHEKNSPHAPSAKWVTSYSLGRIAGHTDFIKSVLEYHSNAHAIVGSRSVQLDGYPSDKTLTLSKNKKFVLEGLKYNILVDAGSAFEYSNIHDLYKFLEDNREYISSCVVIGS